MTTCGPGSAGTCPGWRPRASARTGSAHTILTGSSGTSGTPSPAPTPGTPTSGSEAGATATYVRASLAEVAAALAALTGEPHPLATTEGW